MHPLPHHNTVSCPVSFHGFPDTPDIPGLLWMPTYKMPPWQSIHRVPRYCEHPGTIRGCLAEYPWIPRILWTSSDYSWMPTYIIPHWQSIHSFPGYSGLPGIIHGCQPIIYNTPLAEYSPISWLL